MNKEKEASKTHYTKKAKGQRQKAKDVKRELTWEERFVEVDGKYKRALADYQNLLKRTADEKAEFMKYANEQIILDFLPVLDNLKTSMEHLDEAAETNGWAQGVKYIIKQFEDVLKNLGVEEIEAEGKKFDPKTMDALEGEGEKVKKVVKPGYTLKGKVIVPVKVVLS